MLCLSLEDCPLGAPMVEEDSLPVIPTMWPGLEIVKSLEGASGIPREFCLREVSLPYTCEALFAHVLGLWVICELDQNLTVSEEGVTNVKEVIMSGWTVELDYSNEVDRAICTRQCLIGTYQFHLEGEIDFDSFGVGKALVGDMRLIGSELMRGLHNRTLLSSTRSVCIARKNRDFRGGEIECLSIGGSSSPQSIPQTNSVVLGQSPKFPVTIDIPSYFPLNPQATTYLQYSPMKPKTWNKWSIPSLGISVDSMKDVIVSQGLIVVAEARVLLSTEWKCLQAPYLVTPGIFKRTISNCEHVLQVHGGSGLDEEQGKIMIYCSTIYLRSESFSYLEIAEGEIKSVFGPDDNLVS